MIAAGIDGTGIRVVANFRSVINASGRIAIIVGASLAVIKSDIGEVASRRIAAQVLGACIVIFTNSGGSLATSSCCVVARVNHALGAKVTALYGVRATTRVRASCDVARV